MLVQLGVGLTPMPTEDITDQFNELRNDIIFLLELKVAQESLRYEIETQKFSVSEMKFILKPIPSYRCHKKL